ncbi:MAG TPA: CHAT domain-containing protein [Thermoanaerobaculia bacterium]|nr:CHAT domain-containing protein [Thermoanaerobaculia bacterium]
MRVLAAVAVLCFATASFAQTPEEVVRDFFAARMNGDSAKALTLLAANVEPLLRNEIKNDIEARCLELRSLHVHTVDDLTAEAIAHVYRPPKPAGGHPFDEVERRTFTFVREGDALRILTMPLEEEKLIDLLVAAKTAEEVQAALAAHPQLLTRWFVNRLTVRSIKNGRAAVGRPDARLANLAYDLASALGDRAGVIAAMGAQVNSMRLPNVPVGPVLARAEESLRLAEELGDPAMIAYATINVAVMHLAADGTSLKAENALRRALTLSDSLGPNNIEILHSNLGLVLYHRGDYAEAYRVLIGAHRMQLAKGDEYSMGSIELRLGRIMEAQNDPELALEFFRSAAQRKSIKQWVIHANIGVADALRALGRLDEAEAAARKALELSQGLPFASLVARAYIILTEISIARGEREDAEKTLLQALEYARTEKDGEVETETLLALGNYHFRNGRVEAARHVAREALTVAARFDFPRPERYAALMLLARAERALGQRDKAIETYERAIDAIESARHVVAGNERQQRLFFEPFHAAYTELADLLFEDGRVEEALQFAERGKGRVLLDALGRERKRADEELPQPEREQLAALVKALGDANKRVLALQVADQKPDAAIAEQRAVQVALQQFESEIAIRHPQHGLRTAAAALTPDDVRALARQPDLVILEYVVHQRATHLVVIAPGGALTHHRIPIGAAELAKRVDAYRATLAGRSMRHRAPAHELYDLLLAPAARQLKGKRALAIVPDGALWRLPFESLLGPDDRFVIEHVSCFYLPSLAVYRDVLARQTKPAPRVHTLAAFGNPTAEPTGTGAIYRDLDLGPLPDAEEEARAIAKLWGPSASVYTRGEAREEAARQEMQRARIVHFAAHGIFDDANPMFSQIVLARDESSSHDGMLQAWELARLNLTADLVVLSACDTARGHYGAGEGLIGMSWALFAGGCPSTVVAQWKVSSRAASTLMIAFHRKLSKEYASPFAKADALRAAQLSALRDAKTAHPFYWAAFVLVGSPEL